jgi:uracil-DNA glycosylase
VLALTGKSIPITRARGPAELLEGLRGFITVHPSYLLRIPEREAKEMAYEQFVGDLTAVREIAERASRAVHGAAA